ncbi:unnamed protein product [Penicillium salamii]|uniref:TMEM205-like domain-containing protein n=1 Tax=Penicillium salamii TaxID=1612424 RepID=A0A9W4NSE0_9EURO|nr:unnamed protein product [Penicillium salamii]
MAVLLPVSSNSIMDRVLKTASDLLPYHLLAYGALIGTELFQSFVNTKICYQALPMKEFIALQKKLFPIYFRTQVALTALTAATYPPYSIFSLIQSPWSATPLAIAGLTGCLNWFIYGPKTTTASLVRRVFQGKTKLPTRTFTQRSGLTGSPTTVSEIPNSDLNGPKLHRANRNFARSHAMAIHLNAIAVVATIFYGFSLSSNIRDLQSF